jgi:hypothetical protein
MNQESHDKLRNAILKKIGPDYITAQESAELLLCTTAYILMRFKRKQLHGIKRGRYVFFKKEDILELKKTVIPRNAALRANSETSGFKTISVSVPVNTYMVLNLYLNAKYPGKTVDSIFEEMIEERYKKALSEITKKLNNEKSF